MLKVAALLIAIILLSLSAGAQGTGTETALPGGQQSVGFSSSYAPDSSHMIIGQAEQRRTWAVGLEYSHLIHIGRNVRWDYEAQVLPLYWESDPTLTGTITTIHGYTFVSPQKPVRVVRVDHNPVGEVIAGSASAPIYATYSRESTFGEAFSPLGAHVSWLPRGRIQPSFVLNLGFVVSPRNVPVDNTDSFNFMFALGPGVRFYLDSRDSVRLEYIYHHISNAYMGDLNPGVDQGFVRLTLSRHW